MSRHLISKYFFAEFDYSQISEIPKRNNLFCIFRAVNLSIKKKKLHVLKNFFPTETETNWTNWFRCWNCKKKINCKREENYFLEKISKIFFLFLKFLCVFSSLKNYCFKTIEIERMMATKSDDTWENSQNACKEKKFNIKVFNFLFLHFSRNLLLCIFSHLCFSILWLF